MTQSTKQSGAIARFARVFRTACIVLVASVPSWTHSARDEALSVEEARSRYYSFDAEERDLIHANYERFKALTDEERADLLQRSKNLARISRELESDIESSAELSRKLNESEPRQRRAYMRRLLREEAKDKGMQLRSMIGEDTARALEQEEGVQRRVAYLRRYKRENISRVVGELVRRVGKHFALPQEKYEEIATLATPEERLKRIREELPEEVTEEQLIEMGLPFQITPELWREWQTLSDENFFRAVVLHRSRLTAARQEGREAKRPSDEVLDALMQLVVTVRQRITDFIELEDLSPRRARMELGKRKRAECYRIIVDAKLQSQHLISELEVMNDADFYSRIREVLMHYGGPEQIRSWNRESRKAERKENRQKSRAAGDE